MVAFFLPLSDTVSPLLAVFEAGSGSICLPALRRQADGSLVYRASFRIAQGYIENKTKTKIKKSIDPVSLLTSIHFKQNSGDSGQFGL